MNGAISSLLSTVDALQRAWEEAVDEASPEFHEARRRSLRRHAIETGIIERLYDVDWGVTEALVAEGLTLEATAEGGDVDPETLRIIDSQFEALRFLVDHARDDRSLTVGLIRELHSAITRHQSTYSAVDHLGRTTQAPLRHGEWKQWPNHALRSNGMIVEFAPPEQVASEMDRLVTLYQETGGLHPIIRAAWLHHAFIRTHPFDDGNGRVARALVLLTLIRDHLAPLVVDRKHRSEYLRSLNGANDGDLAPLVRLFGELEITALRFELSNPVETPLPEHGAVGVAHAAVSRLVDQRQRESAEKARDTAALAMTVHHDLEKRFGRLRGELDAEFSVLDPGRTIKVSTGSPDDERGRWWKRQLARTAREVDFYANLTEGSWWVRLRFDVLGQRLDYVVAAVKVGRGETGVLAVIPFADIRTAQVNDEEPETAALVAAFVTKSTDSVTLLPSSDLEGLGGEVDALIDRTLATALKEYIDSLA